MKDIKANTQEVLEKLRKNREKHIKDLEIALIGWHRVVIGELKDILTNTAGGDPETLIYNDFVPESVSDKPQSHVAEYDNAITMLEFHTDATITLSSSDVQNYVQDEWCWKRDFRLSSCKYST